jgi:hypothetical protein
LFRLWIAILNFVSSIEYAIADRFGEPFAVGAHFFFFWGIPVILLYLPVSLFPFVAVLFCMFYIFMLIGDIYFSVFGHERLEQKRGMIDITSVQEMREELISALVKYLGGIVSFATLYNGLQTILDGRAFVISNPSSVPYFDLLYYSVVTISTVGYGDVAPASLVSKVFVMGEILFGIGFALLLFAMLVSVYIDIMRRKGH